MTRTLPISSQNKGTVYAQLKPYLEPPNISGQDVSLTELIRQTHPEHHLTIANSCGLDLDGFAAAGFATISFLKDADTGFLADRMYDVPPTRMAMDQGTLSDQRYFAVLRYTFQDVTYLIYEVSWMRMNIAASKYYMLSPLHQQEIDPEGNSPLNDQLITAVRKWSCQLHDEIYVYDQFWRKSRLLFQAVQNATWEDVVLDPNTKAGIIGDINGFFQNRPLYQEVNVPWKRGIILHGPPGNGKTITIKALMNELGRRADEPLPSLYVKSFENENGGSVAIRTIFTLARQMAPCLLVFEDLDSLVTDELRGYFLNEVDGLESNDGILMIGSTNHLGNLDPAIAKRPSRFDRKYAFEIPDEAQRLLYAKHWQQKFNSHPRIQFGAEAAQFFAKFTDGFSFAYMKELFVTSLMIAVGEAGDQIESELDANKKAIDKEVETEQTEKATKAKKSFTNFEIPSDLNDNKFVQILYKQGTVLRYEMDSTDEASQARIKGKVNTDT